MMNVDDEKMIPIPEDIMESATANTVPDDPMPDTQNPDDTIPQDTPVAHDDLPVMGLSELMEGVTIAEDVDTMSPKLYLPTKTETTNPSELITNPTGQQVRWDIARMAGYKHLYPDDTKSKAFNSHKHHGDTKDSIHFKTAKVPDRTGELIDANEVDMVISSYTEQGDDIMVPLLDSGFWCHIRPLTGNDITRFMTLLAKDKGEVGRHTYGTVFSNMQTVTDARIWELLEKNIVAHTIKFDTEHTDDLRNWVLGNDFEVLKWALACTVYPTGVHYERACNDNPDTCQHTEEGTVMLQKMAVFMTDHLNKWQVEHMKLTDKHKMPASRVIQYQDQRVKDTQMVGAFTINDNKTVSITYKLPILADRLRAGKRWIDEINRRIENIAVSDQENEELAEQDRVDNMRAFASATVLRKFDYLVSRMDFGSGGIVEDPKAIRKALDILSGRSQFIDSMTKDVNTFTARSISTLIGLPGYSCPKCSAQNPQQDPEFIAVDVVQSFLSVLGIKFSE
jgi:hypothetical protein